MVSVRLITISVRLILFRNDMLRKGLLIHRVCHAYQPGYLTRASGCNIRDASSAKNILYLQSLK